MGKKITKELKEFIALIADIELASPQNGNCDIYVSKKDGSYLGWIGEEEDPFELLMLHEVTENIHSSTGDGGVADVGWSPTENRWFGWGPGSFCGFGIGSECKRDYSHYKPNNKEDFIKTVLKDFEDPHHTDHLGWEAYTEEGPGVFVQWNYSDKAPENLKGMLGNCFISYPDKWGRGEWIARTNEEVYEMACDFAESTSNI